MIINNTLLWVDGDMKVIQNDYSGRLLCAQYL